MQEKIETERLVAEIPEDLKRLVDADSRNNKKVVVDSLWREFGGRKEGALERRIEEIENRLSVVKRERNERNREIEGLKEDIQLLEKQLGARRSTKEEKIEEAREKLSNAPRDPDNLAIKQWAQKVEMTPEKFIEVLDK